MDEIKLFLEGIENKIKKLLLKQNALTEELNRTHAANAEKDLVIIEQKKRIAELERKVEVISAVKALSKEDNAITKHKIDEILRDIDKCLMMLNK